MLFPAFVQSHILKGVATVSSFVFVSLLLVNPSSFVPQNDVNANFLSNDGGIDENVIIDPSELSVTPVDANYKNDLFAYTLKPGDNLSSLAKNHGVSVAQLKTFNNIVDETTIRPGQKIYISQTPGFVYIVDKVPVSLMVLSNMYNFSQKEQDDLMRVNGEYDPLKPFQPGQAIIIPNKTLAQAYTMGLLQKPAEPVKSIVSTKKPPVRVANNSPVRSQVTQSAGGNKVLKSRKYSFNENNGMIPGYCTYYAAHKAKWLFPLVKNNTYFRGVRGNANNWLSSAQANGLKTSKTPSVGAIAVFQYGGSRNYSAGHVAVVIDVDRQNKKILVEEMNYVGFGVINQREISMNDSMTETYGKQKLMGFIPVQPLSAKLEAQYKEQLK